MFDSGVPLPISIVLVKTSHPGNIGSVARAMKTMRLVDLRLVSPIQEDLHTQPEALALASGAVDVLTAAKQFSSLSSALHDTVCAFALSARFRELGPVLQTPRQAAQQAYELCSTSNQHVAFVFGAERTGLTNDELLTCNRHVMIPSNPNYSSLNLAQAVQIVTYELNCVFGIFSSPLNQVDTESAGSPHCQLATSQAVAQLQAHWLKAMQAVDFINQDKPKKITARLARLLARAQLEIDEVDLLRGFLSDVIRVSQGQWYPHEVARLVERLKPTNPNNE